MDTRNNTAQLQVTFITKQIQYAIPDTPYDINSEVLSSDLNTLVKALIQEANSSLPIKPINFDFLIDGEILSTPLSEHLQEHGISTEDTIEIEYLEKFPAPQPQDCLMHDDWVAAVHSHKNWLITGCYDNSIHLWSTKGKHTLAIPGHTSPVKAVEWVNVQDNKAIFVSGSHDQSAVLWEWDMVNNSVECVVVCRGHEKGVECLSVSLDGAKFATGSWDNTVRLWSTSLQDDENGPPPKKSKMEQGKKRNPLVTLTGHREAVSSVNWIDRGTVISSGWDHLLKIWDCQLGGVKQEIAGNKAFFHVDWSPLNNTLITASADRHIRLYDPRSSESIVKTTFTSHLGWVQSVRWSKDQDTLFMSGSYDGQVKLWETRSPRTPLYDLTGHEDKILCCDWSNPALMVSGGCDNSIRLFKSKHAMAKLILV